MSNVRRLPKTLLVGGAAVVISTLGLQAADVFQGNSSLLRGLVSEGVNVCPVGTVRMVFGTHAVCFDQYESSPGSACPQRDSRNEQLSRQNIDEVSCEPVSEAEAMPWRFVSQTQAEQLCARVGKRLPSSEEWYRTALGLTEQSDCVVDSGSNPEMTGTGRCSSQSGVYDLVGNVWEWTNETVREGVVREEITLPEPGFVAMVDQYGVVASTSPTPVPEFGDDYAWVNREGVRGVLRGGFYGAGSDAGIFSQNYSVAPTLKTNGIGFRCVQDIVL
ncbi:MAG: SUMF1/EgtB/PvdO family nonheme iron enzyme [Patescibacteria group bacterium]